MTESQEISEEKPKKKGFFHRLSLALFGEDDEEAVSAKPTAVQVENIENMSEESLAALMEMENANAAAAEEEKAKKQQEKEEKKALKEEKAKEKSERFHLKEIQQKTLKTQKESQIYQNFKIRPTFR